MTRILKPFNSRLHRFSAGDDLPDGADLTPHNAGDLTARGFLEGAALPQAPSRGRPRAAEAAEAPAETASE